MSGEGDKKQIQGISEMPEVPWLWDDPGKPGEHEPGEEGELVGIPVLEEGDSQEPVGGEMQEFGVEEEEVVRLGVSAERVRRFKSGGVERMNPGGVDRELGVDPGLEGDGWEEDADVEGSWNEGERRGSPIGLIVLTGLIVVTALGVAFWRIPRGDELLTERAMVVNEKLDVVRQEQEEAAVLMDRIEEVLRSYLAAETVEEKIKYVRQPERVLPLMTRYYAEHELVPQRYERVKSLYPVGVENYPFLVVQAGLESGVVVPLLLQQVGENDVQLDWESEVAYQPMSIAEFLKRRPEEGVDFRVYVMYDQFYAFEFVDPEKYVSLMLTERNSDGFLFGYVERGSDVHEEVARLLGQSEAPQEAMLLKLRFLPGSLGTRSVLVEEVVAPRWAYVNERPVKRGN